MGSSGHRGNSVSRAFFLRFVGLKRFQSWYVPHNRRPCHFEAAGEKSAPPQDQREQILRLRLRACPEVVAEGMTPLWCCLVGGIHIPGIALGLPFKSQLSKTKSQEPKASC